MKRNGVADSFPDEWARLRLLDCFIYDAAISINCSYSTAQCFPSLRKGSDLERNRESHWKSVLKVVSLDLDGTVAAPHYTKVDI